MTDFCDHYATLWETIADRIPDRPALSHGARRVSWAAFEQRSALLAGALRAHGVGHGDTVAAYLYNRPEYFEVFFGALKIRAVPSNVNYRYTSDELMALLDNAEAKVLFFDAALSDRVASIIERAPRLLLVEVGGDGAATMPGVHGYEELLAATGPAPRIQRAEDDVFLTYTGGTTGLPKGVMLRIGQSMDRSRWFRDLLYGVGTTTFPGDYGARAAEDGLSVSAIPASPLMHSTGFIFASLPTLSAGGMVTTLQNRSFDAHELLDAVEASAARVVAIVGDAFALPIIRALKAAREQGRRHDLKSLRVVCSAGVAWSAHIKQALLEYLPQATLLDACGATEGVTYGLSQVRRGDPLSTANFVATNGLKVLSPDGEALTPGRVGLLAGPTAASGYHRDPEKTAATFMVIDGARYVMPGDLGKIESDGTVTFIGRGVTTINTGGEKVYPAEVEDALRSHPGVDDCLVLGIPDERFGQSVAALVVSDGPVDEDELVSVVRRTLAGYKVPRRVRFVNEIPRLPNGKVDYSGATILARPEGAVSPEN